MIPEAKLVLFLWKANALRLRKRLGETSGWMDSTSVFGALGWADADKMYFRNDQNDLVNALAGRGLVEVSTIDTTITPPGDWRNHAFALTEAGLAWAQPYQDLRP
jgi:hypothetical protein